MSEKPAKRKRVEIKTSVKKAICQEKVKKPKMSQNDLVNFAKDNFDVTIGRSTIADLLKDSSKWLNITDTDGNETRRHHSRFRLLVKTERETHYSVKQVPHPENDDKFFFQSKGILCK